MKGRQGWLSSAQNNCTAGVETFPLLRDCFARTIGLLHYYFLVDWELTGGISKVPM